MWPFNRKQQPAVEEKAAPTGTLSRPSPEMFELFGALGTVSGQTVSPKTAARCTAVSAAVRAISEPLGSMPVHVYKRGNDGARERDRSHPAHALLHGMANPWTSSHDFRQQITVDALLNGNGYALAVRTGGQPRELHRLDPAAVSIKTDTGEPVYAIQQEGVTVPYTWRDVLHIRAPLSFDGIVGESPVRLAREAIGLALAMEQHGAGLFGNGARPSGVLEHPSKLGDEAFESLKATWQAAHSGKNVGGTAILEEGMKFNALTLKSTDAQYLELRKFAIDEIARAFGVPPHLLYEMGRATWGNSEELGQSFITYSLLPWIKRWEAALARTLFDDDGYFAEFLVDDFLRADFSKRAEGYSKLIAARVLNPNEARAMEGRAPYQGGDDFINPNVATQAAQEAPPDGAS